jgi:hypothetical protein
MKNHAWFIFTIVYALMTVASVIFMSRTLYVVRKDAERFEAASAERLAPVADALSELENLLPADNTLFLPQENNYMLGLHEGYIAVYFGGDGAKGIKEVTATPLSALPQEEWARLATGIRVEDEEELSLLLQDYGS